MTVAETCALTKFYTDLMDKIEDKLHKEFEKSNIFEVGTKEFREASAKTVAYSDCSVILGNEYIKLTKTLEELKSSESP